MSCLAARDETGCLDSVALIGCALELAEDWPTAGLEQMSYEAVVVSTRSAAQPVEMT